MRFLSVFFDFFLLITIYLAYEICLRSFARLRPAVVKLYGNFWCVSYWFSLIFFANYNLFSLRNMPTKFCEATPSGCEVVWKLVENLSMEISGEFLIGFP